MNLFNFFSGEITIDTESPHYALYHWWRNHSRSSYRAKDFCSYFWAIALWAPLYWFFNGTGWRWLKPWMIFGILFVVCSTMVSLWMWPGLTVSILLALLLIAAVVAFAVGLAVSVIWLDAHHRRTFRKTLSIIGFPVFIVVRPLVDAAFWLADNGWFRWFFKAHKWIVVTPWSVSTLILVVISWFVLGAEVTLAILQAIGILLGCVLIALAVMIGIFGLAHLLDRYSTKRRMDRMYGRRPRVVPVRPSGSSWLQVLIHGLLAMKRKICPLVRLPDEDDSVDSYMIVDVDW